MALTSRREELRCEDRMLKMREELDFKKVLKELLSVLSVLNVIMLLIIMFAVLIWMNKVTIFIFSSWTVITLASIIYYCKTVSDCRSIRGKLDD